MVMVRDNGDGEYGGEDHGDDIQSNHPQRVLTEAPTPHPPPTPHF